MARFPFLDWMRGLALVIMIQAHAFHSWARMDARSGGPYAISQMAGEIAGPLFLFMAGMTFAFRINRVEQSGLIPVRRWLSCLRRAAYIGVVALLVRIAVWAVNWPHAGWEEIWRVDILNSMALALAVFSVAAILPAGPRIRAVLLAGVAIAAFSPLVANLNWAAASPVLHRYLAPGLGGFPLFPCAAYVGFGMTAGAAVGLTGLDRLDRLMQWAALIGGTLILAGEYVANLPYSVYPKSDFWTDNPTLVLMRVGIALVVMAGCYTWTAFCAGPGWSWLQSLGRNSLLVYWVHLALVAGALAAPLRGALPSHLMLLATVAEVVLMVALSGAWMWWKGRRLSAPLRQSH